MLRLYAPLRRGAEIEFHYADGRGVTRGRLRHRVDDHADALTVNIPGGGTPIELRVKDARLIKCGGALVHLPS